jgi:hypothetical protein
MDRYTADPRRFLGEAAKGKRREEPRQRRPHREAFHARGKV